MRVQSMAERKRRHDALLLAGDTLNAAQLRHRTRAYCSRNGLRAPKWAANQLQRVSR